MKRVVFTILISGLFISCSLKTTGNKNYIDLRDSQTECETKVFPAQQGRSCPSGEFAHFTIRQITDFGERPVWSPDGKKLAFIEKEFGDAYEIDLETKEISCLTCEFNTEGFLRIHYMKDGDYLLLGPKKHNDDVLDRWLDTGFYWMPADRIQGPRWLGERHFDGVAVSRESRKIAYTKTYMNNFIYFPSVLYVAELTLDSEIINKRRAYHSVNVIEAQDFLPGEEALTVSRYTPTTEVLVVDLKTGRAANYSNNPGYDEPEGIFPDGEFTVIESDRHRGDSGNMDLDIYMLRLDGTGEDVRRLTHFSDTPNQKASNPAVSPEGCRVAFMKSIDIGDKERFTGTGDGIFMLEFYEYGQE